MTTFHRILAFALIALMLTSLVGPITTARADGTLVLTLGADLNEEQKQGILDFFNIKEGDAMVITVTNADERKLLEGQYTDAQIGTKTFSCALVNPTASGGIQVKTANLSVVTSGRIASILSTSGITDCEVLAAAPFMVSGTGALTGVMMGYEEALGVDLDPEKQQMAIQESTTVTRIGETMGQEEATLVINDIKIRIVRDKAKEESEIANAVNITVDQVEEQLAQLAAVTGKPAPQKLKQDDREVLYDYGRKISAMDYDYDSMKLTLQRVTLNAANAIGIDDPITETFEDLSAEDVLPENSILRATNDESMGEEANITATDTTSMEDAPTLDAAAATVTLNNSLYALFDISMTWTDARRYCRQLGGDLVSVTTLEEQETVEELAAMSGKDYSWLGGECGVDDPRWWWTSGESLNFSNWDDNQPDGFDRGEYFMRMVNHDIAYSDWTAHAGKWNDAREDGDADIPLEAFGFICEIPQARRQSETAASQTATGAKVTGLKLTPVASLEGASRFVYGTNLLQVRGDEGNGLADLNGNVLTDQWFQSINGAEDGLIEAKVRQGEAQLEGVLDQGGNLVVPCAYDDVIIKNDRWVLGIKWALDGTEEDCDYSLFSSTDTYYARITDVDIYYIKDGRGTLLRTLSRQEYSGCEAKDDYINITDRNQDTKTYDSSFNVVATDVSRPYNFSHILTEEYSSFCDYEAEHHYGVQDAGGNVVLAPFADFISDIGKGFVQFCMNDPNGKSLEGIATLNGEILLPAAFDRIYASGSGPVDAAGEHLFRWNHRGYYLTIQDDIYRYAVDGGEITCDTGIDKSAVGVNDESLSLLYKDENDQITLYAADGQVTQLDPVYDSASAVFHSAGLLWTVYNRDTYQSDLIDWHGNLLMADVYSASMSGDGNWLAVGTDYTAPLDIYAVTYVYDDGHEESPESLAAPSAEEQTPGEEEAVGPGEPADKTEPQEEAEPAAETAPEEDTAPAEEVPPEEDTAPAEEEAKSSGEAEAASADSAELIAALENTITTIQNTDFDANRERIAQILDTEASLLTDVNAGAASLLSSAAIVVRGGADVATTTKLIESAVALLK